MPVLPLPHAGIRISALSLPLPDTVLSSLSSVSGYGFDLESVLFDIVPFWEPESQSLFPLESLFQKSNSHAADSTPGDLPCGYPLKSPPSVLFLSVRAHVPQVLLHGSGGKWRSYPGRFVLYNNPG